MSAATPGIIHPSTTYGEWSATQNYNLWRGIGTPHFYPTTTAQVQHYCNYYHTTTTMEVESHANIDESLYSRQLYVLGKEAMEKMAHSNVLLVGLGGVGVEIAKNVALAGVKSMTLFDPKKTTIDDLASQFYLTKEDIGKPRAAASHARLSELNKYTPISVVHDPESLESLISQYQVVIVTDVDSIGAQHGSVEQLVHINNVARASNTNFIWVQNFGLAGTIFNDFGADFKVIDSNGEEPVIGSVAQIEKDGEVIAPGSVRHGLEDGMAIELKGVNPPSFNGQWRVKVKGPLAFDLTERLDGKPAPTEDFVRGGDWKQIKEPNTLKFATLEQQLGQPAYFITDFAKMERPPQLHLGFLALLAFKLKHSGELPRAWNAADAEETLVLAKNVASQLPNLVEKVDEEFIKTLAKQSRGQVAPINTVIGGIAAQEVLKAVSGKFTPIHQSLYFDAFESLPDGGLSEEQAAPKNTRYDPYYAVWGHELMEQLANLKVFLVGAGAIGCEVLKSWALLGVGSGPNGHITVTDNDSIEKSNLNRQFLFRPKDVGRSKSEVAAAAAAQMNPSYTANKFTTLTEKVGPDTQNIFNDQFWESLDLVTNALDNVEARTYVDRRCVFFTKPLVESGTLGTKGNVQIVVPYLTESYSSSTDPPEQGIPLCTLRSFPAKIDHTIAWAKAQFQDLFNEVPTMVNAYLTQPDYVETTLKNTANLKGALEQINSYLVDKRPRTFENCIDWAVDEYEYFFNHDIKQLLYNFPPDARTSSGALFWEPPKRCPSPLEVDLKNENTREFIIAAANLRAFNYGLKGSRDPAVFEKHLANYKPQPFEPSNKVHIKVTDDEADRGIDDEEEEISKIREKLPSTSSLAGFRLSPAEFEKDDDTNFHIDFINAASNLRAENYGIEPVDRSRTKFIAGKIIPAIATTTAVVTGLSTLEAIKVVQKKKIEDLKNGFISLALPFFGFSEPMPSTKITYNGDKTIDKVWGRFTFGDIKLEEFIKDFESKYGLEISMISCGNLLLYASFFPPKKLQERLPLPISKVAELVSQKPLPEGENTLQLEICADDQDGEDVEDLPFVVIELKQ